MDPRLIKIAVSATAAGMLYLSSVLPEHADMLIAAAAGLFGWVGLRRPGDERSRPKPRPVQ